MIRIYLDSSAFVKKFSLETGTEIVKNVFEECEQGQITMIVSQ